MIDLNDKRLYIDLFSSQTWYFGPIVQTNFDIKFISCKWIYMRKRNEQNEIVWYKAQLMIQRDIYAYEYIYL